MWPAKIQCNRSAVKTRSQLRKNAPLSPRPKDMEVRAGVCVKLTGAKQTISWAAPPAPPHFFRRYCAFMNGIHLPSAPRTCDESVRWSSLMKLDDVLILDHLPSPVKLGPSVSSVSTLPAESSEPW